ncbi:hypothetical protein PRIPAC_73284 [Pristionchus pacificus]|uniref:Uncharacterized protein n=1 Tax=Pristionchus pacificus TaxID=54126 RepID=A0A2A6C5C1_PRIPA|nr:hypothetical protein PRIPAC_73284 [Pristionchus pacificus]|eukprot:PDM73412.1 hypothetical protein PRIPAC_40768 [Pristionchus pacificus]
MSAGPLEEAGLAGPSNIRAALGRTKKAHTLINAVKKFQTDNSIKNNSVSSALKMLDMIGVKRADCYDQMISSMSEKVVGQIKEIGKDQDNVKSKKLLEKQLNKSFKTYKLPQFRPAVLEALTQMDELPQSYIDKIVADPELYADVSIKVKRQIWIQQEDLFVEAVKPVIAAYIAAKRAVLCSIDPCPTNFFSSETTKSRRQFEHVQELMHMFGKYPMLYEKMSDLIREAYRLTADPLYCSLKLEVIMAAHECTTEHSGRDACLSDPCHSLAWVLDICLRDKHIEPAQIARIKNLFESMKRMSHEKVGDLAMVTADPHVVHFLCTMAIKLLRDHRHIPREQGGFVLIIRLLTLGSYAHHIVSCDSLPPQMVEVIFFTKFLPAFGCLIAEDVMRLELAKHEKLETAEAMDLYSEPNDAITVFLKYLKTKKPYYSFFRDTFHGNKVPVFSPCNIHRSDMAAALLWIHYVADLMPRRGLELRGLLRFMRLLPILKEQTACRSPWSHLFMHRILTACQSARACAVERVRVETLVNDPELIAIVIDQMFLAHLKIDLYLKYQLLRLVNQTHRSLHPNISQAIMEHIAPGSIGDCADIDRYTFEYDRATEKLHPKTEEVVMPPPKLLTQGSRKLMTSMTPMTPMRVEMTPAHNFDY